MRDDTASVRAVLADWGTSKLRLWAWYGDDRVSDPVTDPRGMKFLKPSEYPHALDETLAPLGVGPDVPVVVCGMAGAKGGWCEAGYMEAPAPLARLADETVQPPGLSRPVRILPGVCARGDRPDIMRGEETQLLGVSATDPTALVCLPGTHSKWARIEDGRLTTFTTQMTGELFEVLSSHSILALTLDDGWNDDDFAAAVREALADPQAVWSALFGLRVGAVLGTATWQSSRARLSGLLIGAECAVARAAHGAAPVKLVGGGGMGAAYASALTLAGFTPEILDGDLVTRRGLIEAARTLWSS